MGAGRFPIKFDPFRGGLEGAWKNRQPDASKKVQVLLSRSCYSPCHCCAYAHCSFCMVACLWNIVWFFTTIWIEIPWKIFLCLLQKIQTLHMLWLSHFHHWCSGIKILCRKFLGRIWFGNVIIFPASIFEIPAREFLPPFAFFLFGTFLITPPSPTTELFWSEALG